MHVLIIVLGCLAGLFAALFWSEREDSKYYQQEAERYRKKWEDAASVANENYRRFREVALVIEKAQSVIQESAGPEE